MSTATLTPLHRPTTAAPATTAPAKGRPDQHHQQIRPVRPLRARRRAPGEADEEIRIHAEQHRLRDKRQLIAQSGLHATQFEGRGTPPSTTAPQPVSYSARTDSPNKISDPSSLCCSIVQATVEALRDVRPLTQLTRWLSPEIYEALARRRELTRAALPQQSRLQAKIRRARVVRVSANAAEATVIVQDADRVRAAAIRMEHLRGNWRVVALELG